MKRISILAIFVILLSFHLAYAQQGDGIPDNCEYAHSAYYNRNLFPRYEYHNQQFVLADWATGENVRVLETGLATESFWIISWSPNCHYIVAAVGANRDYYLWDAVNGGRIGVVEHGRQIDWSPDGTRALIQTDNGAYLWNPASNQRMLLTTEFNDISNRNFSRVGWNMAAQQVTVNKLNGERALYDLNTGVESILPPVPHQVVESGGFITISGIRYSCQGYSYYDNVKAPNIYLDNDNQNHIALFSGRRSTRDLEVVKILELSETPYYRSLGHSTDCRYFAAALGNRDHNDTVVWDIVTGRRLVWEDARLATHSLNWSRNSPQYVVIETRKGGYLWDLSTDRRNLLHEGVRGQGSGYYATPQNFHRIDWTTIPGQLFTVGVDTPNGVNAYDLASGEQLGFYYLDIEYDFRYGVSYQLSSDGSKLVISSYRLGGVIWDRNTNTQIRLDRPINFSQFSPDSRYFLGSLDIKTLGIWDLNNLNGDGSPNYVHPIEIKFPFSFVDETTIQMGGPRGEYDTFSRSIATRWNIITGEFLGEVIVPTPPTSFGQLPSMPSPGVYGISGSQPYANIERDGIAYNCVSPTNGTNRILRYEGRNDRLMLVDWRTGEGQIVESSLPETRFFSWSPGCYYFAASVQGIGVIIWSTETFERLQVLSPVVGGSNLSGRFYVAGFVWSGDDSFALLQTNNATMIWNALNNSIIPLSRSITLRYGTYWDYGRNQVIIGGSAFDLQTGVEREFCQPRGGHNFVILGDGRFYVSFTRNPFGYYDLQGLSVCDLNSLETATLYTPMMAARPEQIALSPDGRYLVIARETVRAWDLQNLAPLAADRRPISQFTATERQILSVRFIDATTIETTTGLGVQRWNIFTGEYVP